MNPLSRIVDIWMSLFSLHMFEISLFVLLVWIIDKFFRLETRLRYLLWILALAKIFIPPVISLPITIQETVPEQVFLLPIITEVQTIYNHSDPILTSLLLFGLWAIWTLAMTTFILYKNIKFRQQLSDAVLVDNSFNSKSKSNTLIHGIPVFITPKIKSPLLLGFWKPRLYLPSDWQNWSQNQLKSIIAHEKAHLNNLDMLVLVFQNLSIILFGINPFIWLVHKRLSHLRELHCDEIVIQRTGIHPIDYGKLIYDFIEKQAHQPNLIFIGKSFFENNQSLFRRINHVLNLEEAKMKTKTIWDIILPIFLGLLILPFSWKCGEKSSQPISENDSELNVVQPPLDYSQQKGVVFKEYDKPPMPIGGFKAIQQNLQYPEIARKAGIEGRVILNVYVNEQGEVEDVKIAKSINEGQSGFEEVAIAAVKSVKWEPAENKGSPVAVWVAIPVVFKLNGDKGTKTSGEHYIFQSTKHPDVAVFNKVNTDNPIEFQPYDEPPQPVGGFGEIQKNLQYPEIARKAGIEGRVIVLALVSEEGKVIDTRISESLGQSGCDEAAVNALKSVKWKPAVHKGEPVKVWVAVPVLFKLK
ncbi:MAG: TonB family protein [bacterium]